MPETIDITPTWEEILPTWLTLFHSASLDIYNNKARNFDSLEAARKTDENARAEFLKMARAADKWNAHCKAQGL